MLSDMENTECPWLWTRRIKNVRDTCLFVWRIVCLVNRLPLRCLARSNTRLYIGILWIGLAGRQTPATWNSSGSRTPSQIVEESLYWRFQRRWFRCGVGRKRFCAFAKVGMFTADCIDDYTTNRVHNEFHWLLLCNVLSKMPNSFNIESY